MTVGAETFINDKIANGIYLLLSKVININYYNVQLANG